MSDSSVWFNGSTEDLLTREIERLRTESVLLLSQIEALERMWSLQSNTIFNLNKKIQLLENCIELLESRE